MEEKKYLKWYNKVGYGTGDLAGNVVYAFLSSFVMLYLTNTVGLDPGVVGTLIMVSKLFDGVSDMFFGTLIDKTKSRLGKARPWMLYAYIGCAVTLVANFAIPESLGKTAQYAWFFIAYTLLNAVFFTANNIAYASLVTFCTNGQFVGYAEDSFTPSEFDLTPFIREKENVLAVQVHKMSTAAFLEDQDFFRFFGIFRNVTLKALPDAHMEDVWFQPVLNQDNSSGKVSVIMKVTAPEKQNVDARFVLTDREGTVITEKCLQLQGRDGIFTGTIHTDVQNIKLWDNHSPYLYHACVELIEEKGGVLEVVPYDIGFRRLEVIDKVIYLNGKRLVITGVNRHEWNPKTGRCIGMQEMTADIDCMLRNNINAVRTCHYPDQIPWYYLCDKAGIYVMAETNLESHGTFQKLGAIEPSCNVPGSIPQWREVVLDRAISNFEAFKNHTSVLFWSLGNESYAGDDLEAMNTYFKEKRDGRLVHYESSFYNRAYEDTISDVESRMYAKPKEVEEYLNNNPKKPYLLCEFMHDMGNSMGGLGSYMKLIDQYEMYHGGFIWDFIDQAILVRDPVTGKEVLRYGGDFDDRPADYEFSANGIVFADRKEKPAMQEVRYYYGLYR